ncbi:cupin domain-containing protein [Baekduia soli]|uniref:Cupin domain-containing protein n=1 Tax=Baekduia soli TaxID=496014 RepID=A0A5B8U6H7_9ACTN|nr:cupin domain-containing protein [Baekduia soli]QEC48505.1 cupin domain-containing protein [Baekduia soli]
MSAIPVNGGNVVRADDLVPTWNNPHAREPGYLRSIISYYGGVEGFVNDNPETGLLSERTVAGLMWLPVGSRQFGVHQHTITEIYIILQGQVESIEPGRRHVAGPMDCLYMPPGAPHAVRTAGDEDVVLLWCHDAQEPLGSSTYFDEDDPRFTADSPSVELVRWEDLEPRSDAPGARVGGTLRSEVVWAGPETGEQPVAPGVGAVNDKITLGCTILPPGNVHVAHAHPFAEHYIVASGRAAVVGDEAPVTVLGPMDYVGFDAGVPHALRAVGYEPLRLITFQESGAGGSATYAAD